MKKHDENQDVIILSRRFQVNPVQKTIGASRKQVIGNKSWGRLDFLTHYCGYVIVWGDGSITTKSNYEGNSEKKKELRDKKKASKEHALTNKNSKPSKRR